MVRILVLIWAVLALGCPMVSGEPEPELERRQGAAEGVLHSLSDLDPLIQRAAETRFVLLGEASHGTSEFYTWRAVITEALVEHHGFTHVGVEGDWEPAREVDAYLGASSGSQEQAREVLGSFQRWPQWMWANEETATFVEHLRLISGRKDPTSRVGFYGMDLYGAEESVQAVLSHLEDCQPDKAAKARRAYDPILALQAGFSDYPIYLVEGGEPLESRMRQVVSWLKACREEDCAGGEPFATEQAALVALNAEAHFRKALGRDARSWNRRVRHFQETLDRLYEEAQKEERDPRLIVWAHNTHIGDARATEMIARGQQNIGQLLRERYGDEEVFAVGFGTYQGTVMAGSEWGGERQVMTIPEPSAGSIEHRLAEYSDSDFWFFTKEAVQALGFLADPLGHRAIGVVYEPKREHLGNYVATVMADRYDAFIFLRQTSALEPLSLR